MSDRDRNIGKKVKNKYGIGEIIGIDLPKSKNWRYKIKLDDPKAFWGQTPCFDKKELTFIIKLK